MKHSAWKILKYLHKGTSSVRTSRFASARFQRQQIWLLVIHTDTKEQCKRIPCVFWKRYMLRNCFQIQNISRSPQQGVLQNSPSSVRISNPLLVHNASCNFTNTGGSRCTHRTARMASLRLLLSAMLRRAHTDNIKQMPKTKYRFRIGISRYIKNANFNRDHFSNTKIHIEAKNTCHKPGGKRTGNLQA